METEMGNKEVVLRLSGHREGAPPVRGIRVGDRSNGHLHQVCEKGALHAARRAAAFDLQEDEARARQGDGAGHEDVHGDQGRGHGLEDRRAEGDDEGLEDSLRY